MQKFKNISNHDLSQYIDDWIKSERDRKIMKRRIIDGITHEKLAEEFELSPKQIQRIVSKCSQLLADKIL